MEVCGEKVTLTEEEIRKRGKEIYGKLYLEWGANRVFLEKVLGINSRVLHYYLATNKSPVWSKWKDRTLVKLIEGFRDLYPNIPEITQELEEYLCTLREYAKNSKNTSRGTT